MTRFSYHPEMPKQYEPKSDFLKNFDWETVPLDGHEFGKANMRRILKLMNDPDDSNRDWATFLLATSKVKSDELTAAFLKNTKDENYEVRCEAIRGLAKRDPVAALPIVRSMLMAESVALAAIEAAGFVADKSLAPALEEIKTWWGDEENALEEAINSCRKGKRSDYYNWP